MENEKVDFSVDGDDYVVNIALKREDGKVEQDTLFSKTILGKDFAEKVSQQFKCSVLVSNIGTLRCFEDDVIRKNTIAVDFKKEDNNDRAESDNKIDDAPAVQSSSV